MSDALLEAMREINATLLPSLRREAYNEYMRRYQSAADHLITNISSSQVTISCLPISYSPHLIELALNRSVIGTISFIQAVMGISLSEMFHSASQQVRIDVACAIFAGAAMPELDKYIDEQHGDPHVLYRAVKNADTMWLRDKGLQATMALRAVLSRYRNQIVGEYLSILRMNTMAMTPREIHEGRIIGASMPIVLPFLVSKGRVRSDAKMIIDRAVALGRLQCLVDDCVDYYNDLATNRCNNEVVNAVNAGIPLDLVVTRVKEMYRILLNTILKPGNETCPFPIEYALSFLLRQSLE